MNANQNVQPSGGRQEMPGAVRMYEVGGKTFPYRNYLSRLGLRWDSGMGLWVGTLKQGHAWFLRERLRLQVANPTLKVEGTSPHLTTLDGPLLASPPQARPDPDLTVSWDYYSAVRTATKRDSEIRDGRNINERRCHWGCELCANCMECVSNADENGDEPDAGFASWNDDETNERLRAVRDTCSEP